MQDCMGAPAVAACSCFKNSLKRKDVCVCKNCSNSDQPCQVLDHEGESDSEMATTPGLSMYMLRYTQLEMVLNRNRVQTTIAMKRLLAQWIERHGIPNDY